MFYSSKNKFSRNVHSTHNRQCYRRFVGGDLLYYITISASNDPRVAKIAYIHAHNIHVHSALPQNSSVGLPLSMAIHLRMPKILHHYIDMHACKAIRVKIQRRLTVQKLENEYQIYISSSFL
jgi:hypothetical protein